MKADWNHPVMERSPNLNLSPKAGVANGEMNVQNVIEVLLSELKSKQEENKKLKEFVQVLELQCKTGIMYNAERARQFPKQSFDNNDCSNVKKHSSPDIFLFPDHSTTGGQERCKAEAGSDSVIEEEDTEAVWNLVDTSKEPAVVPEQDFNNVVNELIKTKTTLFNVLKYQKVASEGTGKVEEMKRELNELRFKNQKLEEDLQKMRCKLQHSDEYIAQLKQHNRSGLSDIDELVHGDSQEHSSLSTSVTLQAELDQLKDRNRKLKQENESKALENQDLKRRNRALQEQICGLNENVTLLGIHLHQEKQKSSKAVNSLGSLRQQYEELFMEKNALEKERMLEQRPSRKYTHSAGERLASMERHGSGSSNFSSGNPGTSPRTSSLYGPFNILPDSRSSRQTNQNNLSPQLRERKPSNLPQSSSLNRCPRCFAEYSDDVKFLEHCQKCINCE